MAILTKNALSASNQASFPNNTTGAITPQILRNFNQDVIDTLVDSLNTGSYAITTGSNDFTQPNNFTSISASSFVSASVFVGDGSKLTNITASVAIPISDEGILQGYATQLNFSGSNISASLQAGIATISVNTNNLVTTSSFNSYTSSNDSKVNSLISATASYANSASVAAVDAAQQSQINSLIASTSSFALTSLNAFTASQETKDATLGLYTASVDEKFTNIGAQSSSWDNTNLNSFTASQNTKNSTLASYTGSNDTKWSNLGSQSGSWITESESGSFLITASVNLNTITFTKGNNTTFAVTVNTGSAVTTDLTSLNAFTASQDTKNSTLATYTASVDTKFSTLGSQSGSWITESETASFARTNVDNNFSVNQTFTNITAVSASFQYVQTTYETSSVIYSSGSNQFGDELSDIQTLSGSVKVQGTLTINGLPVATGSTDISSLNAFTASQETKNSTLATYTASVNSQLSSLTNATASYAISSSVAAVDAGQQSQIDNLIAWTSSVVPTNISSLNSFTASQETKNSTLATYTQSVDSSLTNINSFTASNGNTSLNSYTASNDTKWSNLAGQTGSYVTSAITASSIITASVNVDAITFTKGDGSQFTITVATGSAVSASYAETASLAINALDIIVDAKNTTGAQLNKGTIVRIIGATGDNPLIGTASWTDDGQSANTLGFVVANIANDAFGRVMTQGTLLGVNTDPALGYVAGQLVYLSGSGQYTNVKPDAPFHEVRLGQVLRAQQNNGSIYVLVQNGYELDELHDVAINTGSLANNDLLAYNSTTLQWENKTLTQVGATTTSSFNSYTSSTDSRLTNIEATTASLNTSVAALNTFTTSQDTKNSTLATYTGSNDTKWNTLGGQTGSFATTGSNNFVGVETINSIAGTGVGESYLLGYSGSLVLGASAFTPTYAALTHLSSSTTTNINLIFKTNTNTADTIISGSGNLFFNPATPATGFKRYLGLGNIALNGSNVPLISSSMAFSPTMNNNYYGAGGTTLTMRGPVSSSVWNINGNSVLGTINIGNGAVLNAEKLTSGLTMANNSIGGILNIVANQSALTGSTTVFTQNIIAGTTNLQLSSSAASMLNNIINDSNFILDNRFYSSSVGLGLLNVNRNNIGGQANQMIVTGALPAGGVTATSLSDNFIFGGSNILFSDIANARVSGSTVYHTGVRNGLMGNQLIVSASSLLADQSSFGSVFVGRYNADDARRNKTSDIVFAVGTGNTAARKTGFLIDSGSNTFIEGTLNVSGSTTMTGSLILSSSNAIELIVIGGSEFTGSVYGNVVSMSVNSNTASMDLALGNYFELSASVSPIRIEVSNLKGGLSSTLALNGVTSSTIVWSSNVLQPSGSAYTASVSGSNDILSFVAFNSSTVNVVSTLKMI